MEQLEPLSSYDVDQCRPVSASQIETCHVVVVLQGERWTDILRKDGPSCCTICISHSSAFVLSLQLFVCSPHSGQIQTERLEVPKIVIVHCLIQELTRHLANVCTYGNETKRFDVMRRKNVSSFKTRRTDFPIRHVVRLFSFYLRAWAIELS